MKIDPGYALVAFALPLATLYLTAHQPGQTAAQTFSTKAAIDATPILFWGGLGFAAYGLLGSGEGATRSLGAGAGFLGGALASKLISGRSIVEAGFLQP